MSVKLGYGSRGKKVNSAGEESKFIDLPEGRTNVVFLTDVDAPEGEEPNGQNCIVFFSRYELWEAEDGDGNKRPALFPKLEGEDPGSQLGLTPKFRALALVIDPETETEKILGMSKSVYNGLVEIKEASGTLKWKEVSILRTGTGIKTRYSVTNTGNVADVEGDPETDLMDHLGPSTPEEQIEMLKNVNEWHPSDDSDWNDE